MKRVLIVRDKDGLWYVRRVKLNHQDDSAGTMIYHCDKHLGGPYVTPEEAIENVKRVDNH